MSTVPSANWDHPETLTPDQLARYLLHIGLDPDATFARPANTSLLADIQLAHIIRVPYENSLIHLAETPGPFRLMGGPGMRVDLQSAYANIVERGRGGFCFLVNGAYAALLRGLGFGVSEVFARNYAYRHKDPTVAGWVWTPINHVILIVDTVDGERYQSDPGYGGGSPSCPLLLKHGTKVSSVTVSETFELREEALPGSNPDTLRDVPVGWTLYRHFAPSARGPGHMSPMYHFLLQSATTADLQTVSHTAVSHPAANHTQSLIVTRLNRDGTRDNLTYFADQGLDHATLYKREGVEGTVVQSEDIPLTNEAVLDACKRVFNF